MTKNPNSNQSAQAPIRSHGPLRNWLLLKKEGHIEPQYRRRAMLLTALTTLGTPARFWDRLLMGRKLKQIAIDKPPVFILGHWRSGTTHLHNLLTRDPQFGFVSTLQTASPKSFLTSGGLLQPVLDRIVPKRRKQDNMEVSMDLPQEEELALTTTFAYTCYHGWFFPTKMLEYFQRYLSFEDTSEAVREAWKKEYFDICKRATLKMNGRRLLLKNPPNTARIPLLKEMFPGAKFIHIYRDPFAVFNSTRYLYEQTMNGLVFQSFTHDELEENVLAIYEELMTRYFKDRALLDPGSLAEVRFEDLERDPMGEVKQLYDTLGLGGFDEAKGPIEAYIASQKSYQKNVFKPDAATVQRVAGRWKFALDTLGYGIPEANEEPETG